MNPPKPAARPERVSLWRYLRLFRQDILSAQPARLYRAWMAEFRTPFFRSYLCNDPALVATVLRERPQDFPKSRRIREGLAPLLGRSVFQTNGAEWEHQRRIIDPAFEGGRVRDAVPAMLAAGKAALARLAERAGNVVEIEAEANHLAADVIFRALFSVPIEDRVASETYRRFRAFQRGQPILNLAALLPLPRWLPRGHRRRTIYAAAAIRTLIRGLVDLRAAEIAAGVAPDDLATRIMTTPDPATGKTFSSAEMVDQVAIFFLAGHETSASALSWAIYMLATHPEVQKRVAAEARAVLPEAPGVADVARLALARDVFRETLRLYPPVPMMVREARCPVRFRDREVRAGSQIVISPWHLHRHERIWNDPDGFNPGRWEGAGPAVPREAYLPFSAGPRICPGAGFAGIEGPLLLALLARDLRFSALPGRVPVPVAHLTVRSRDGIHVRIERRLADDATEVPQSDFGKSTSD
jgi:cytochrome P450